VERIADVYKRFLRTVGTAPARYDDQLFEAFLEREGISPHGWSEEDLMDFFEGLGMSRAEAREAVEQLSEWGPRATPGGTDE
jgi:hypothetical protein